MPRKEAASEIPSTEGEAAEVWLLRLYVAGQTAESIAAFANIRAICAEHLAETYQIELVDLVENPQLAARDQIVATPTLVRMLPPPLRQIIGDLSETERVLAELGIRKGG